MQESVAFLSSDVGRLFRKRFDVAARQFGVTGPQWRVLAALIRHPGMNQVALASWLEVEGITAGRMIDRLEKAGFVERRPDPADRRAWLLFATDAGNVLFARMRGCAERVVADAMTGFSEEEHAALAGLLARLRLNLCEDQPGSRRAHG